MGACLKWSPRPDLNWWPPPYQGDALPTELHGQMVGMPGLEPGNSERADLQSAAVAAVPHPHSVFKHLWESSTPQAEMNNKRLLKTCQRKPRRRAYSCHKAYTRGGRGMLPSPLSFAFGSAARYARESRGGQHPRPHLRFGSPKSCLGCSST